MKVEIFGSTDVGQVRDHNEDDFVLCKDLASQAWNYKRDEQFELGELGSVLFVADGMGGANAGEVASHLAQATVDEEFKKVTAVPGDDQAIMALVKKVIVKAHQNIVNRTHEDPTTAGMGTTAVLCWVVNEKAYVAWSGDSRMYVYRDGAEFYPITDDHSIVWELVKNGQLTAEDARLHENSNIITQSLGDEARPPKPEAKMVQLYKGDRLLLCSDGLTGMISDNKLGGILSGRLSTAETCKELIHAANAGGGTDNITVLLLDVLEASAEAPTGKATTSTAEGSGVKTTIGKGSVPIDTVASKGSGPGKGVIMGIVAVAAVIAAILFFVIKPGAGEIGEDGLDSLGNPIDTNLSTLPVDTPMQVEEPPVTEPPVEETIEEPVQTTPATPAPDRPNNTTTTPANPSPPSTEGEKPEKPEEGNTKPLPPSEPKDTSGLGNIRNQLPSDTNKTDKPAAPGITPRNPSPPQDTTKSGG